ncbi:GFA family protein [Parendozoicomonas callyspongiae]|uniref:GFA family protein n=1 Tax=Parendozoicomonas callyspongiae TaxID=2942213 RepID=UPI0038CD1BE9
MSQMSGSCRCDQLQFTISGKPVLSGFCHCHACQKRTSGPCAGFLMVKKEQLDITGQSQQFKDTGGSGKPMIEHHCSICGTTVFTELKVLQDILAIPASTLNNPSQFSPETHVWVSSLNLHFAISDNLSQEPGPPRAVLKYLA